jgi:hypothetical protein
MSKVISIEILGNEFPEIVNALVRLPRSRRIAMLEIFEFPVSEIPEKPSGEFARIEADGWSGLDIEVFKGEDKEWNWKPLPAKRTEDESRRTGKVPTDFDIYVCANRDFSWVSDSIPLSDGTSAKFHGTTIGSLMQFALGEQKSHSAKVGYLNKHPHRLDEDLIALQEELDSEDFEQRS